MSFNCIDLEVIPQYIESCWFNAILMASLYSQGSRKIVIETLKKNKSDKSFFKIIKAILKNYGKKDKLKHLYKKIRPELLLLKILKINKDKDLKANLKSEFGWYTEYINRFYRYLGVKCVDIIYDNDSKTSLINFENKLIYKKKGNKSTININERDYDYKNETKKIKEIIKEIPDILILYHSKINDISSELYNFHSKFKKRISNDAYNLKNYDIKTVGLSTYEDTIEFNGYKYKLDSCLISNYNIEELKLGHAIAGLQCENEKYVYNGWTRKTIDTAKNNQDNDNKCNKDNYPCSLMKNNIDYYPCSLMKYNWNLKKSDDFCLNLHKCKLDFITNKRDLCFNFSKGRRVLVYTKINDNKEQSITTQTFPSKISNISSILKSFKGIKKNKLLTQKKIIENLKELKINIDENKNYDLKELNKYYIKKLKEFYNLSSSSLSKSKSKKEPKKEPEKETKSMTKIMIIELIKKKYPDIKGLSAKKKEELLLILYKEQNKEPKKEPEKETKPMTKVMIIEKIKKKCPQIKGLAAKKKEDLKVILRDCKP